MLRTSLTSLLALCALLEAPAQATLAQWGKPFNKALKGASGDIYTVVDGVFAKDGRHLLYVEEGLTPKVVRLDALLQPTEELVLKDHLTDGAKWTGVTALVNAGSMRVLLVSAGKKGCEFGVADVNAGSAPSLMGFRKVAAFDMPYANNPSNTMAVRPLPDPILFSKGLAYAQRERLIASPDGEHYLLNGLVARGLHAVAARILRCAALELSTVERGPRGLERAPSATRSRRAAQGPRAHDGARPRGRPRPAP